MNKFLVITGGSRGIGAATITRFMQDDWQIINLSRSIVRVDKVNNITIDLAESVNKNDIHAKLLAIIQQPSHICLVHNAASYKRDSMVSLSIDDLTDTLQTNVVSAVSLNQVLVPLMLPGSSIIYIGSTLSEKAVPGSASYIISKHALIGLMRATCQDLSTYQIRSCCVCPGLVNTSLLTDTMDKELIHELLEKKIIGKRLIEPDEIAKIIHFCAMTSTINGAIIHANLGQFAE